MKKVELLYAIAATIIFSACNSNNPGGGRAPISIPVYVEEISTNDMERLSSTNGTLIPMASAEVSNKIEGKYYPEKCPATGRVFKIGDSVKKGTVLANIVDEEYRNSVALETKRINLEIAQNEYEKYIALQDKGGATQIDIQNAEVKVATTKKEYENAQISIENMVVRAPISGVIVDVEHHTTGVEIDSNETLFSIMDYSDMLLNVSLSESTMSFINTGMAVYVSHYSLPNEYVEAKIDQLSPYIDSKSRTYKGVILVDNHDLKLKPGMFVKTDIVIDTAIDAVIIPKEIVRIYRNKKYIFVADGTTAIQREIKTGIENEKYIEVTKGLEVGEKLIVEGYQTLRNNSKISIQ